MGRKLRCFGRYKYSHGSTTDFSSIFWQIWRNTKKWKPGLHCVVRRADKNEKLQAALSVHVVGEEDREGLNMFQFDEVSDKQK